MHWGEGKQCEMPGPFDSRCQLPLMTCAYPGLSPGFDLCTIGQVAAQTLQVLVPDGRDVVSAKGADLSSLNIPASAGATPSRSAASAKRT